MKPFPSSPRSAITVLGELTRIGKKTPEISVAAGIAGLRKNWLPFEVPEASREMVVKVGDAMTAGMERDPMEAVAKFEALVKEYPAEPAHIPALVGLTMIYRKRDQPRKACGYAEKAAAETAKELETKHQRGEFERRRGRFQ